jgi:imidazolonepropionase-like amidohydrolase
MIKQISSTAITPAHGSTVINARGCVLMPGLTDAHWHMTTAANTMDELQQADTGLMYANTVVEAQRTVLRGFTAVRNMAGPAFGVKAAIDAGIWPFFLVTQRQENSPTVVLYRIRT